MGSTFSPAVRMVTGVEKIKDNYNIYYEPEVELLLRDDMVTRVVIWRGDG